MTTARESSAFVCDGLMAGLRGDVDAFLGILHPEVEIHEPAYLPYGGVYRGREAVRSMLRRAGKVVDFSTLEFVSTVAEEDKVVMMMTVNVRSHGEQRHIIEQWVLSDGLVRHVRVFWDALP
jgi:ketosteroid isomerase-like protein